MVKPHLSVQLQAVGTTFTYFQGCALLPDHLQKSEQSCVKIWQYCILILMYAHANCKPNGSHAQPACHMRIICNAAFIVHHRWGTTITLLAPQSVRRDDFRGMCLISEDSGLVMYQQMKGLS